MQRISIVSMVAAALALAGCGHAVGSKADAAKAGQELGKAGQSADSGSKSSPLLQVPLDASGTVTVKGKSGTATVTVVADTSGGGANVQEQIVFDHYSADGNNTFDGNLTQTVSVQTGSGGSGSGVAGSLAEKGKVTETGDYDSTLDVDYTETFSTQVSSSGVSASVVLDGKITADGTEYDFNHESFAAIASGS